MIAKKLKTSQFLNGLMKFEGKLSVYLVDVFDNKVYKEYSFIYSYS